jgi:hypothetical protein
MSSKKKFKLNIGSLYTYKTKTIFHILLFLHFIYFKFVEHVFQSKNNNIFDINSKYNFKKAETFNTF